MSEGSSPSSPSSAQPSAISTDQSWLDNLQPRKSKDKDTSANAASPTSPSPPTMAGFFTDSKPGTVKSGAAVWSDNLEKRSTLRMKKAPKLTKNPSATMILLGQKSPTLGIHGTIFNLDKNPFEDFPELQFTDFPQSNLALDKRQQKEREAFLAELKALRDRGLSERDAAFVQQRKREEKMLKEFQEEMNERAQSKLADFQKLHKLTLKEKKDNGGAGGGEPSQDGSPKEEQPDSPTLVKDFENSVKQSLEQTQAELESRLIRQHLKWILPWFQSMKSTEIVQLTQIHALELIHLEELHRDERRDLKERESRMAKLDFDGFEKELKGTVKERKKANRQMSKDEITWEKDQFQQVQNERFEEHMNKLNEEHARLRQKLDEDQQAQIDSLLAYFDNLEQALLGWGTPNPSMERS